MIKLSIIIVNYNVKHFLEQALNSIFQSNTSFEYEVLVVDNYSADGSVEMLIANLPQVKVFAEKQNHGFSKGNNIAIKKSKGEFVLLLNPDTVLEEDTLEKVVEFMDKHKDVGGLGVKMMDGSGKFLPESKRGFPTPMAAFYKMSGLASLFPGSKKFGQYHLTYLDKNQTQEVDVLSGAFMLLRKSVLDNIGLLDETFFMYGEDIDLSYRIKKEGFKNFYFADTKIIHFKGESTKKGSLNYVRVFYQAMIIFLEKHYSGPQQKAIVLGIKVAIYLRAALSIIQNFVKTIAWPLVDIITFFIGMVIIKEFWENVVKINEKTSYPIEFFFVNVPLYITIWVIGIFFSGGYDKNYKYLKIIRGLSIGTLIIAAIYGFLSMKYRFSRGMIVTGFVWAATITLCSRLFFLFIKGNPKSLFTDIKKMLIVGDKTDAIKVVQLLQKVGIKKSYLGFVCNKKEDEKEEEYLGKLDNLKNIADLLKPDEIIFCSKHLSNNKIIGFMSDLGGSIEFKIAPEEGAGIIGSHSKNSSGDLITIDVGFKINSSSGKRNKRIFDAALSLLFIILFPIILFFIQNKKKSLINLFHIFIGKKSFVGYSDENNLDKKSILPKIKPGILFPKDSLDNKMPEMEIAQRANFIYAKEYQVFSDLNIVFRNIGKLGR